MARTWNNSDNYGKDMKQYSDNYGKINKQHSDNYGKDMKQYSDNYGKIKQYRDNYDKSRKQYSDNYDKGKKQYSYNYDKSKKQYSDNYGKDTNQYSDNYDKHKIMQRVTSSKGQHLYSYKLWQNENVQWLYDHVHVHLDIFFCASEAKWPHSPSSIFYALLLLVPHVFLEYLVRSVEK